MSKKIQDTRICVVGLGYVGLPLATTLSKYFTVSGFDINKEKIEALKKGVDETGEVEDLKQYRVEYSSDPEIISRSNFIIVAVPTPITDDKKPDLEPLKSASEIVGKNLKSGSIIVYESTVYPGCTEEDCLPILERESGLKYGADFKLGYSPERVNPGNRKIDATIASIHRAPEKVIKVVSGSDADALEWVSDVYGKITEIHRAPSIKVAEAAKVIENVQRSLNIALMNELAIIFDKLGINTRDVLAAAGTKWSFHPYYPGLVGGHCIGIDPYYLTHKAQQVGYEPKVILAGQDVNEYMATLVASKFKGRKSVLVMGLTFKENVPDIRNSKAGDLVNALKAEGVAVSGFDPLLDEKIAETFGIPFEKNKIPLGDFDGIIVFSPHNVFKQNDFSLSVLRKQCSDDCLIFDVKGFYDRGEAEKLGFKYSTL